MSDIGTQRMIDAYWEQSEPVRFFTSLFKTNAKSFHRQAKIGQDVIRRSRATAVARASVSSAAHLNEITKYTNKEYTPAVFNESCSIGVEELSGRQPGNNPFEDVNFNAALTRRVWDSLPALQEIVYSGVELMCSQVLQTGTISLVDESNAVVYSEDFGMKATHKVTAATPWADDGSTGDPMTDLGNLAIVVQKDGRRKSSQLYFGTAAWRKFIANAKVKAALTQGVGLFQGQLQLEKLMLGQSPAPKPVEGATRKGFIVIDDFTFELWTYDGTYVSPYQGTITNFISTNNVIMLPENPMFWMTYGEIPRMVPLDARVLPIINGAPRLSNQGLGVDLSINAFLKDDGRSLIIEAGTRPLPIPSAIDTYACLTVA